MRLVDRPERMPHHCAVTLKADDPKGFVDTGTELPCIDPHIYLSVSWLHDIALDVGLVDEAQLREALDRVESLEHQLAAKQDELAAVNAELDAISVIESSERFKARRKPGPKKKAAAAA